jgi:hypothetical protein
MTNHNMDDTLQSLIWLEIQDGHQLKILFTIEAYTMNVFMEIRNPRWLQL